MNLGTTSIITSLDLNSLELGASLAGSRQMYPSNVWSSSVHGDCSIVQVKVD